jgi:Flp pilus assembly protein TadD
MCKKEIPPELAEILESAMKKEASGRINDAISQLTKASHVFPHSGSIWFLLGRIAFNNERFQLAQDAFRKLTEIKPKNDLASSGLFHSLWVQEKEVEALEEMKRFIFEANNENNKEQIEEYLQILSEINSK